MYADLPAWFWVSHLMFHARHDCWQLHHGASFTADIENAALRSEPSCSGFCMNGVQKWASFNPADYEDRWEQSFHCEVLISYGCPLQDMLNLTSCVVQGFLNSVLLYQILVPSKVEAAVVPESKKDGPEDLQAARIR